MDTVYIMRGIPGSGKSQKARELAGKTGIIHSTDDYFINSNGVYRFNLKYLRRYHERNLEAFCESVTSFHPIVICDNTNMQHWEFKGYVDAAISYEYKVEIVCMPHIDPLLAAERNVHGVTIEAIERMLARWEP